MENVDQNIGVIFKNLGEHQFRIDNHRDCINELIDAVRNIDGRLKFCVTMISIGCLIINNNVRKLNTENHERCKEIAALNLQAAQHEIEIKKLKAEIEELKQVEGE